MIPRILAVAMLATLVGCAPSGPATTDTKSSSLATLAEREAFLHGYVPFRRTYESLDFDIHFFNGGGFGAPAPSEWDIRLAATAPASELQDWIPEGVSPASSIKDTSWLESIPTTLDLSGVTEWYDDGGRVVGIDRDKRIVVYRLFAN